MRNIEVKARIASVESLTTTVAAMADRGAIEIDQDNTFFRCDSGRLKLREFSRDSGELIFYRRADERGPKESFYVLSPTSTPHTLRQCLALAHGEIGRVRKRRDLFLVGRTRVHLDRVEGLGDFLELEVVLADGESAQDGVREAHALMERLGLAAADLVEGSYFDLIQQRRGQPRE